jgi:hypothetical protein
VGIVAMQVLARRADIDITVGVVREELGTEVLGAVRWSMSGLGM